jgi:hypothetical protein
MYVGGRSRTDSGIICMSVVCRVQKFLDNLEVILFDVLRAHQQRVLSSSWSVDTVSASRMNLVP